MHYSIYVTNIKSIKPTTIELISAIGAVIDAVTAQRSVYAVSIRT